MAAGTACLTSGKIYGIIEKNKGKEFSTMTFWDYYEKLKKIFMSADVSKLGGDMAMQINLTGEGEGIFYAEYNGGKLSVEPYSYDDRDAMLIADAKDFLKIAEGKMDPIQAYFTGKLKVEGNLDKALVVRDLVKSK